MKYNLTAQNVKILNRIIWRKILNVLGSDMWILQSDKRSDGKVRINYDHRQFLILLREDFFLLLVLITFITIFNAKYK
jgi:hypothetical protein